MSSLMSFSTSWRKWKQMSGVRPIFQFCFILLEMEEIDSRANKNDYIVSQYGHEHYHLRPQLSFLFMLQNNKQQLSLLISCPCLIQDTTTFLCQTPLPMKTSVLLLEPSVRVLITFQLLKVALMPSAIRNMVKK